WGANPVYCGGSGSSFPATGQGFRRVRPGLECSLLCCGTVKQGGGSWAVGPPPRVGPPVIIHGRGPGPAHALARTARSSGREPPRLLRTVMFCGFVGQENWPRYLPTPLFVSVPINWLVAVTKTCSVALPLVLVASTRSCALETLYSARVTVTVSVAWGVTVRVAVRVTPPAEAEMVTGVFPVTARVVTAKVALVAPAGTVTLARVAGTGGVLAARGPP